MNKKEIEKKPTINQYLYQLDARLEFQKKDLDSQWAMIRKNYEHLLNLEEDISDMKKSLGVVLLLTISVLIAIVVYASYHFSR
jgi:DNA repair exonuclease SbcCD ATPase subunit